MQLYKSYIYAVRTPYEKWQKGHHSCKNIFLTHSNYHGHLKSIHENSTTFAWNKCLWKFALPRPRTLVKVKKNVHGEVECDNICNSFELIRHCTTNLGIFLSNTIRCDQCRLFFHQQALLDNHIAKTKQCIDSKISFFVNYV